MILLLAAGSFLLFAVLLWESSFDVPFINPSTTEQTVFLAALSALVFLLFVTLTFVLARNLIKLFAERRLGVLGSKFRTRLVVGSLLLSFLPVIVMFWFAYGLMNRSIERWFSTPVEEVRQDTALMSQLLAKYAAENARAEATGIAAAAETQHAFEGHSFSAVLNEFQEHEATLQGGFAIAILSGEAEASFHAPMAWPLLKPRIPLPPVANEPQHINLNGVEYVLGAAQVGDAGEILVAMPLPKNFAEAQKQLEASQQRYLELAKARRTVRRTYMVFLWWITGMVLFASMWLALYLSRLVTRPVVALAEATQEISRGNLDYRVEVPAADELGDLVRSFNQMAAELATSRRKLETASQELTAANSELEQRRQHIETILESIPTGVLSLDAQLCVRHVNPALLRMLRPSGKPQVPAVLIGAQLRDLFAPEVFDEFEHLLRRADRMGTTTTQMEFAIQHVQLNVAVTVATLEHVQKRIGYVVVFEDLSDLLRAQKQAAWREVARRVAHEIKNPLTPITLSADRILRHLDRGNNVDPASLEVVRSCAETICGAAETVRNLVNEFSTLARFPSSRPEPTNVNAVVDSALAMFNGRVDGVHIRKAFGAHLPQVMADSDSMKRAIANLVDNAAEAVQDSLVKEIEISTSLVPGSDFVEISVADSGPGVTPEVKERLFLPYFSTKKRGTGLGLAIVSRIIEDHQGSIRVEENQPAGARFIIELPVASVTPVRATQHA
ncbi:MAG TPA: ATP-binding protein [Terriglobales bacterium]|nr:ATP-binding protein [Terriglobales bacterium]